MTRREFITLLGMLYLTSCAPALAFGDGSPVPSAEGGTLIILVASDLHYISPRLTDNGPAFTNLVENSDGKLMLISEELIDAFVNEVAARRPDALILSGDLSFNGGLFSHEDLAAKLQKLTDEGIAVFVIPGNHDVNYPMAASFSGDSYEWADRTSPEDFMRIYSSFGYSSAISLDPASNSYVAKAGKELRLLMLDTNSPGECVFQDETLDWVKAELEKARSEGDRVISVSHQNLYLHNDMFAFGYRMANAKALHTLLREYGVLCHLSGHMHIQHTQTEDGVTEILTGALSVSPARYGELKVSGGNVSYRALATDVAAYAHSIGLTDERLLEFSDYARAFFEMNSRRLVKGDLADLFSADPQLADALLNAFVAMNDFYFAGEVPENFEQWDTLPWESELELLSAYYVRTVLRDFAENGPHTEWDNWGK